jgi:hypothetical protein
MTAADLRPPVDTQRCPTPQCDLSARAGIDIAHRAGPHRCSYFASSERVGGED